MPHTSNMFPVSNFWKPASKNLCFSFSGLYSAWRDIFKASHFPQSSCNMYDHGLEGSKKLKMVWRGFPGCHASDKCGACHSILPTLSPWLAKKRRKGGTEGSEASHFRNLRKLRKFSVQRCISEQCLRHCFESKRPTFRGTPKKEVSIIKGVQMTPRKYLIGMMWSTCVAEAF